MLACLKTKMQRRWFDFKMIPRQWKVMGFMKRFERPTFQKASLTFPNRFATTNFRDCCFHIDLRMQACVEACLSDNQTAKTFIWAEHGSASIKRNRFDERMWTPNFSRNFNDKLPIRGCWLKPESWRAPGELRHSGTEISFAICAFSKNTVQKRM